MSFKKSFFIFSILVFSFECGGIFFSLDPAERARKYIKLALEEYKKAIKTKPTDVKLIEEYRKILESVIGKTEAKVELALLFKEVGLEEESSRLLLELTLSKRAEALKYIEEKIKKTERVKERINLYSLALVLSPSNGLYWFNIGRLYLGLNNVDKGVECLEKAYIYQVKEPSLFYYLGNAFIQKGDYEKAEFYLKEGLKVKEDVNLHKLLYTLYKKEGKIEYALKEKEKIRNLLVKKPVKKVKKIRFAKISGISPYTFFAVSKKRQYLYVYNFDGAKFNMLGKYPCTTGKNSGKKTKRGDGKTPEGTYLILYKIDGSKLPPKYGIAAFPINYPNMIDKRLKRNGDGIWFHATPIKRPPYNSEGCIVINDRDMEKVMEYIKLKRTFIYIKEGDINLKVSLVRDVKKMLDNWVSGWESMDIERYISFYDKDFYSKGKNRTQWKNYKERINKKKKFIKVKLEKIQILPYGKTEFGEMAIAFFKQRYKSSNFSSTAYKILYLVKRKSGWKILGEKVVR